MSRPPDVEGPAPRQGDRPADSATAKQPRSAPSITREALEAVVWQTFPRAAPGQVDAILDAADTYAAATAGVARAQRLRAPGSCDGPTAQLLAAEHRRVLTEALRER